MTKTINHAATKEYPRIDADDPDSPIRIPNMEGKFSQPESKFVAERVPKETLLTLTAQIVAAHLTNNKDVRTSDIPEIIKNVHRSIMILGGAPLAEWSDVRPEPFIDPEKSVYPDYIVCLEDGKKFKSLFRHLRRTYNLSPEEYRRRWNLPNSYPMDAPNTHKKRQDAYFDRIARGEIKVAVLGKKPEDLVDSD